MTHDTTRFKAAIAAFDRANAADPTVVAVDGEEWPKELLYAARMTRWLERFAPDASEALRLAARCQHIRRWEIPRDSYPRDRAGYLAWRAELKDYHARLAGDILAAAGYDDDTVARVRSLLRKERLKHDAEAQTLEDVVCLVFLESYFAEFSAGHEDDKVVGILRKTWRKMSPAGREVALALDLPPPARGLLGRALDEPDAAV